MLQFIRMNWCMQIMNLQAFGEKILKKENFKHHNDLTGVRLCKLKPYMCYNVTVGQLACLSTPL